MKISTNNKTGSILRYAEGVHPTVREGWKIRELSQSDLETLSKDGPFQWQPVDAPEGEGQLVKVDLPAPRVPQQVTPRQFRLALIDTGILPTQIESALNNIEDEIEKAKALTEWEYALSFDRSHSLIVAIADQLNVSEEDIDDLFREAAKL